jgi:hypothetical protein
MLQPLAIALVSCTIWVEVHDQRAGWGRFQGEPVCGAREASLGIDHIRFAGFRSTADPGIVLKSHSYDAAECFRGFRVMRTLEQMARLNPKQEHFPQKGEFTCVRINVAVDLGSSG